MREWLDRDIRDPRAWGTIAYLLLAFPLGLVEFIFLSTAISTGAGLAITLIGIPILIATVYAWRWLAALERRLIGALTGRAIPEPYRPVPVERSRWGRLQARLADPSTWKDLVFLLLQFPLGLAAFLVTTVVLSIGLGGFIWPLLGLGLVAGLDVWIVLSYPPLRESEAADEQGARALRRRRRLRTDAGALAIFNLFIIGIWLAGGAGYFWPAWVILGSSIAIVVKALPWPDIVRERYAG